MSKRDLLLVVDKDISTKDIHVPVTMEPARIMSFLNNQRDRAPISLRKNNVTTHYVYSQYLMMLKPHVWSNVSTWFPLSRYLRGGQMAPSTMTVRFV